ncbi:NAD(P)/FAD-dependent oxidoreductase [Actinospica durhamensis]|uniref:NAD(P)/FAD-dependent oxidoreductase n=1 Tax=Actinospica durhamensis TaxID=1508375 RepID=A0A941EMX7_9ACTN|nr:NAD(P)/FAD-dependent oxidoreductase [Actinospica durhamensis]MBR7833313.1 NAD(P)/FAD-dependent oxidoreductase [Actinospica durhamensis]
MSEHSTPQRVVIIGGGFAGLFAARALRRAPVQVTVIDRVAHHLFQPLLYQCATGILSEGQIAASLRDLFKRHRNVEFVLAEVADFDTEGRRVLARRPGGTEMSFPYDHLIVAGGVHQSYFGHDEFAQWAPGMKSLSDALSIRRKVFGAFELAESAVDPEERRRWLTFALVGAGPTGVELAGQLRELATHTLRAEYRSIDPEEARVLLFDGGESPLAMFGPKLSAKAAAALRKLGVELHMGAVVTQVDEHGLLARGKDGQSTRYEAATVLWTAGVQAPAMAGRLAQACGAQSDRAGRIEVLPDLTVPQHPEISVVGDMMSLDKLPGVAEVAMQTGFYAARRVRLLVEGRDAPKPFRYRDLGSAAYIARGQAVLSAGPLKLSGLPGWIGWLFIHIAFLTGYRNRLGAILTWVYTFAREVRRERAFIAQPIDRSKDIYAPPANPPAKSEGASGGESG